MGVNLKDLKPALPSQSASLAPYVNDSETLQQLVKLGIDLSKLEKEPSVATHLALADFETDCKPYILFFHSVGVKPGLIGDVITRYPKVFFEPIENLEVRVNYFTSKKFSLADVAHIIERKPSVMAMTTKEIDAKLGYLQKLYKLNGNELRLLVNRCPSLIAFKNQHVIALNYQLSKDLLELNESQRKKMFLEVPEIAFRDPDSVQEKFDYLTNVLGLPAERIVEYPLCLSLSHQSLKMRHKFLAHLGRTQYDPRLPNYIPLGILMGGSDKEFCEKYVKVSLEVYEEFIKTL
ncbi:hypothetical protein CAPTEDRAFT_122568 [Capitella teleta]|uniref:Uncharacterized protein n=1 Tax=Capitella teleta TaxID=283909 RepID=R7UDV3_CAPTE|nr:hypothetical protein CAPTEDRAFT_122568 [Capitella teleta]|eukprot:ELU01943.1 hypothetical protein CAPTEDRAFT_122568 [Capitella teleta]